MPFPRRSSGVLAAIWLPICGTNFSGDSIPDATEKGHACSCSPAYCYSWPCFYCPPVAVEVLEGTHGSVGTPPGAYTITVTGTSGMTHSTMATLRVQ